MAVIKILNSPKATIIPCIHEESGRTGLFNIITNEFYPVEASEVVMCKSGSDLPSEYQEVEYLESTSIQYIDTGVIEFAPIKTRRSQEEL